MPHEASADCVMQLMADGWKCTAISGEMEMSVRDLVVNEFREGKTSVLITTDVLSRGFDVQQVQTHLDECASLSVGVSCIFSQSEAHE